MEVEEKEVEALGIAEEFISNFSGNMIFAYLKEDTTERQGVRHIHKDIYEAGHALWLRNKKGCGIFFTVNDLDRNLDIEKNRTSKMCTRIRAVFMDDDNVRDSPRVDFPLKPNLIVETSKGKYHYYWLIEGGIDCEENKAEWESIQKGIAREYDGDKNARDLCRILRIPGYRHCKKGWGAGKDVTYIDNEVDKYDWEQIKISFGELNRGCHDSGHSGVHNSNSGDAGNNSNGYDSVDERSEKRRGKDGRWIPDDEKSIEESENEILSGENYHENLVSLSWQMLNEGVESRYVIMSLQGIMNQCEGSLRADSRWQSRYGDISRIVEGGKERMDGGNVDITDIELDVKERIDNFIPWPPGLLGDLAEDAYNMAHYQYKEVAIVSAVGLVAGIAGRKFNISNTGLNLYMTLIMETGMGKDSIGRFINGTLNKLNGTGQGSSFIGSHRYTSAKSMYLDVKDSMSKICVFTEAGILMKTKSGDQESILRTLLSWYSKSGKDDWTGSESYSSKENMIPSVNAVSLSIISEATPDTLLSALTSGDTLENGFLPRQSVYRINGERPEFNSGSLGGHGVREEVMEKLRLLVKKCSGIQSGHLGEDSVWDFVMDEEVKEDSKLLVKKYNKDYNESKRSGNTLRANMATRMYLKILKFSAIASVINHGELRIKMREWSWGVAMVEYEFASLESFFVGSSYNDEELEIASRVAECFIKLLRGLYNSPQTKLTKKQIERKEVPYTNLSQVCCKLNSVKRYGEGVKYNGKPSDGFKCILNYMIDNGYFTIDDSGRGKGYGSKGGRDINSQFYTRIGSGSVIKAGEFIKLLFVKNGYNI